MALVLADRVKETTNSTGTTAITLAGAATGYQTFSSAVGNANTTYYTIADQTGANWEVGLGTYTTSGNTLSRDTVLASSNAGSLVTFTSGTKDVFVTYPAERALYTGGPLGTPSSGTLTNATGYTYANLSGTVPTWNQNTTGTAASLSATLAIALGGTNSTATATAGGVGYGTGTAYAFTAAGTSGQVLTSNGAAAPTWTTASSGGATKTISNKTAAYTVVAGDLGTIINCTSGTFTVSLTAAASLGSGFTCTIWNTSSTSTDAITIDPAGAETIDGKSTLILRRGEGTDIVCDGTNWQTSYKKTMRYYSENSASTSTRPSATGAESVAIHVSATASAAVSMALGYIANATAFGASAIGERTTAGSLYSTALGTNSSESGSVTATGAGAMALGGSYASGIDSFAAGIANNTSTYGAKGDNSVAIGSQCLASGSWSIAMGRLATASGSYSVAFGYDKTLSGNYSFSAGGYSHVINQNYGIAIGGVGTTVAVIGKVAIGTASTSGWLSQLGILNSQKQTTNATPALLTSDGSTATSTNQVILPNNSAYAFTGLIVSRRQAVGGTESAAWKVEGLIRREATAASTTLVASTVTAISNVPGWTLALSADTTNGGLAVTFTGAAATNIRTVATINTSEVTYA